MSRRIERVASLIREIVGEAIQTRLSDPRIPPITSVTRVEVSADFSVARIFVSAMTPESDDDEQRKSRQELCLRALRHSAGHLRRILGQELTLRKTPQLEFHLDESLRLGFQTVQLIDRVMEELNGEPGGETADDADGPVDPGQQSEVGGSAARGHGDSPEDA